MTTLMKAYTECNDRLKAGGAKLVSFPCPACNSGIETLPAPKGEQWDSLSSCPHCEALYMKITKGKNAFGVLPPPPATDSTKAGLMKITVGRFPIGSWTTGGPVSDSDYEHCEVYVVEAPNAKAAKQKAQAARRKLVAKVQPLPTQSQPCHL